METGLTLSCTITAFHVSTLSVQSRLFTYLPYSNNHGFSRVPFSTLKNGLFRRCLKSMIYEIISVKCYLYFGVSKPMFVLWKRELFQVKQDRGLEIYLCKCRNKTVNMTGVIDFQRE